VFKFNSWRVTIPDRWTFTLRAIAMSARAGIVTTLAFASNDERCWSVIDSFVTYHLSKGTRSLIYASLLLQYWSTEEPTSLYASPMHRFCTHLLVF
jgi:hypothetical protein